MSEKRIVVPDGMVEAAIEAVRDRNEFGFHFLDNKDEERIKAQTQDTLEAALRWAIGNWGTAPNAQRMPDLWYWNSRAKWEQFKSQWNSARDIPFVDLFIFFVSRYHSRSSPLSQKCR